MDNIARGLALQAGSRWRRSSTAVILGDSITNQITDITVTPPALSAKGYFTFANLILGNPFRLLNNAGVSSETSTQIAARVGSGVLAYKPGWCFVLAGINDAPVGISAATTIANLTSIYTTLNNAGIRVVALTVHNTTVADDATGTGAQVRDSNRQVNAFIREYCRSNGGMILADTARMMNDPATGIPVSAPAVTVDGTHPNIEGACRMGRVVATAVSPFVAQPDTTSANPLEYTPAFNGIANGDNASGSNNYLNGTGITGTGPDGWYGLRRATGTAVASKVARADGFPEPLARLAITAAADWDGAALSVGGNNSSAGGRWDQTWAASAARVVGDKRRPTTLNGYQYLVIASGTTGGTEPTWSTVEGQFVTDGTVTYVTIRQPVAGEAFYGEAEVFVSGLTAAKGAMVRAVFTHVDTTGAVTTALSQSVDVSGTTGKPPRLIPQGQALRLRTEALTIPATTMRYLYVEVWGYGEAGASFNLDVGRVSIRKV